jgi:protein-arginine kinase activator protein McsA
MRGTKWSETDMGLALDLVQKGLGYGQIAERVGRTTKAVKVFLGRAGCKKSLFSFQDHTCTQCGKTFRARVTTRRKFCSTSCSTTFHNHLKPKRVKTTEQERLGKKATKRCCVICSKFLRSDQKKYCSMGCIITMKQRKLDAGTISSSSAKKLILLKRGRKCEVCSNTLWNGEPIPIETDHVDGNHKNNTEVNLRLICPNCHAQTPTYKNRNKGKGRGARRERYAAGLTY